MLCCPRAKQKDRVPGVRAPQCWPKGWKKVKPFILELLIILLLIVANGIFAMAEIAVVSARKARLQQRAGEGKTDARLALQLAESPGRFLSTVQIGMTLVGVLAGAFGGATVAQDLAVSIARIPLLAPYSETLSVVLVVLAITYLSLVIGELVPKRLALNDPEGIAAALARPMQLLAAIAAPVVLLLTVSTDIVVRLLRVRPSAEPPVTEDEIRILIEAGTEAGVFEEAEQDMVAGVFRLGERRIDAVMTPRTEIEWLDTEDTQEEITHKIVDSTHSRFPVAHSNLDEVLGLVRARDVLARCLAGEPLEPMASLQPPYFVPESASALHAIELLKDTGTPLAFVLDEYGGLQGMVTVTDIVEAIVGDLAGTEAENGPKAVQREDGSWLLDGLLPIDEFKDLFDIDSLPGEAQKQYRTLGGFIVTYLGRIPSVADQFAYGGLRFEVVDMEGHRVDQVLVHMV
jgi:putative hemolysin